MSSLDYKGSLVPNETSTGDPENLRLSDEAAAAPKIDAPRTTSYYF